MNFRTKKKVGRSRTYEALFGLQLTFTSKPKRNVKYAMTMINEEYGQWAKIITT
jgi:hypothetical protein